MNRTLGFAEALGLGVIVATLVLLADLLLIRFDLAGILLAEVFLVGLPAVLWALASEGPLAAGLRLRRPAWRFVAAAALLVPALWIGASALLGLELRLVPLPAAEGDAWKALRARAEEAPVLAVAAFVVAPALAEETLFRGVLLASLERRFGARAALWLSAVLFALFHRSPHRLVPHGLLGLVLGTVAQRSGSILPCVLIHLGYNLGILLGGDRLSAIALTPPALAAAAVLGLCAAALLRGVRGVPLTALLGGLLFLHLGGCAAEDSGRDRGTVVVALENAPANLDPRWGLDAASQNLHQLLYASLLRVGPTGELENDLATSVEWIDDLTWRVQVRSDATFHDRRKLTARDVAATFAGLVTGEVASPRRAPYARVERVEAVDERTVLFHTCEPFPSLPVNLVMGIVPAGSPANLANRPIGAGPFRLGQGDGLTTLVLERHPLYHGEKVAIERIRFRIVPDATTRALELRKGGLDLVLNALPLDTLEPLRRLPALRIDSAPGTAYWYVGFNFSDPRLARHEVREAIAIALDRDALVRHLLRGYAEKASGPLAPGNPFHVDDLPVFAHDPERARRLLDAAGFPDPDGAGPALRLKLVLSTSTNDTARLQALAMRDMLGQVGIELEVRSYEFGTFFDDVRAGRFQIFTLRWVGVTDPDWLGTTFHSRAVPPRGQNRGHYANAAVDRVLDRAATEMDPAGRYRLYAEAQRLIAADLPYVSLYHVANVAVRSERIEGLELYAGGEFTPFARLRIRP